MDKSDSGSHIPGCDNHPIAPKSKIAAVSGYDVQRLLFKIQRAKSYLPHFDAIPKSDLRNHSNPYSTDRPAKHIGQIESIIAHMKQNGFFAEIEEVSHEQLSLGIGKAKRFHFIEFGCGTAKLSDHVSMHISCQKQQNEKDDKSIEAIECAQYQFILIDRQPMKAVERYCDGRIRSRRISSSSNDVVVQRFVSSISETKLWKILHHETVAESSEFVNVAIAMSKHLCGSATDDAIECLQCFHRDCSSNTNSQKITPKSSSAPLIPLIIATCCHYACEVRTFTKPPGCQISRHPADVDDCDSMTELSYLQHLGFDERDVEVMITISQWASIKIREQTSKRELSTAVISSIVRPLFETFTGVRATKVDVFPPLLPEHPLPMDIRVGDEWMPSASFEQHFSLVEKSWLGKYSKILLDTARAYYLKRNCGYKQVRLIHYTTLSPERNLLIATS